MMEKASLGKIGRYEIIQVLHRGAMGEVILAQDENLGRRVAVKRPFPSFLSQGIARFRVEAQAATLRHPNIPAVYEMGMYEGLPFIAMEYVQGETLEAIIESRRELDLMIRLRIMEQVCSALGFAHKNGVIHRDIRPANIMVRPDGTVKIIDFKNAPPQDGKENSGVSTAATADTDDRADLFQAGVALFRLLAGTAPFAGGDGTSARMASGPKTGLGAFLRDYPPELDLIIERSLAGDPADRYQTGEEFADALHEVVEDLKRGRVAELLNDAGRLTGERDFVRALELLDEAIRLHPSNTQARSLRKVVREHQERVRRAERLSECLLKSDQGLLAGNFDEALNQLRNAEGLDPSSSEVKKRIAALEEKKRLLEKSARALAEAESLKACGDRSGALRVLGRAIEEDPENRDLLSLNAGLTQQAELEAQRGRLEQLQEGAARALAVHDLDGAVRLVNEAAAIDPSDMDTGRLRRDLARAYELERRLAAVEDIRKRVHEFIRNDAYDPAMDVVNDALDELPNELVLHRLKAEVEAEASKYDVRRIVDLAISQADEVFSGSPFEALAILRKASENIPGEERLEACERSLRRQLDTRRPGQLKDEAVRKARELMRARQLDKAVGVLESFQGRFGPHSEVDELLSEARGQLARRGA